MIINARSTGNSIELVKRYYRYIGTMIYDRRITGMMMGPFVALDIA